MPDESRRPVLVGSVRSAERERTVDDVLSSQHTILPDERGPCLADGRPAVSLSTGAAA